MNCVYTNAKLFQSLLILFSILAILIGFSIGSWSQPLPVLADAGGFPTRTPTITPTLAVIVNPLPTYLPTATSTTLPTLTPVVFTSGQDLNQQAIAPTQQVIPPEAGGGIGCWPVALLIVVAVILVVTYIFTRRAHSDTGESPQ